MNIRDRRAMEETAARAFRRADAPQKIILVYALVCCGLSLLSTVIAVLLGDKIAGTGGLGNIGLRSVLSTGQSVLPLITTIVTACLNFGYHTAVLSIIRGYDASPATLSLGFRRFGVIFRTMLLQGLVYFSACLMTIYLSSTIFVATALGEEFTALMEPYLSSMTVLDTGIILSEEMMAPLMQAMIPMFYIMGALGLLFLVPLCYRFRMVNFALADDPDRGAIHALLKSRHLMRRNCIALFRLDLSMWWFYLGQVFISLVCYGDVLLPMVGVSFPWNDTVSYYLFFLLSALMEVALYYFTMNHVYTVYAVAYDALQEEQPQFNMPVQM